MDPEHCTDLSHEEKEEGKALWTNKMRSQYEKQTIVHCISKGWVGKQDLCQWLPAVLQGCWRVDNSASCGYCSLVTFHRYSAEVLKLPCPATFVGWLHAIATVADAVLLVMVVGAAAAD
jgi:hypothetical protein